METLPYVIFTIHIPMEWLAINITYVELINYLLDTIDEYFNIHHSYNGIVINILGIEAALYINIAARIIWFKRIRIEDDPRPEIVHYHPPLAPPSLEEEWHVIDIRNVDNHVIINEMIILDNYNINDNINEMDNINEIIMNNEISSTYDD